MSRHGQVLLIAGISAAGLLASCEMGISGILLFQASSFNAATDTYRTCSLSH